FYEKLGRVAMQDLSPTKAATPPADAKAASNSKATSSAQATDVTKSASDTAKLTSDVAKSAGDPAKSTASIPATTAWHTGAGNDAAPEPGMVYDGTHLNAKGSIAIGEIVAAELRRVAPELALSIRGQKRFMIVATDASGDFKTVHAAIA